MGECKSDTQSDERQEKEVDASGKHLFITYVTIKKSDIVFIATDALCLCVLFFKNNMCSGTKKEKLK